MQDTLLDSIISLDEFDSILRDGGNEKNSVLRIANFFSKEKSLDDNIEFLYREYLLGRYGRNITGGGKGFRFGSQFVSIWFDETGITVGREKTALDANNPILISWEESAIRISELIKQGKYISHDVLDEAVDNEKLELAEDLWFFYRDDMHKIPDEWNSKKGGYPEDVAIIKGMLDNPNERQNILNRLKEDVAKWHLDPDNRTWHNPERLITNMENSMIPPKSFPVADINE